MPKTKESVNASMIDIGEKFKFCPFCNKNLTHNIGPITACYKNSHIAFITMNNSFRIECSFYIDEILHTFQMWLLESSQCKILIKEMNEMQESHNINKRSIYLINNGEKVFDTIIQYLKEENFQKINKLLCLY